MAESLDDLDDFFARWQRSPDISHTVALCDALRGSRRGDLVEIVGSYASRQRDIDTLTAAARMYTAEGRLDDAQEILVAAGRLAPRDGDVYRWLGEVLLRRGDAERAEKVLERAVQLNAKDPTAGAWLAHARALLPMQQSLGTVAVAREVGTIAEDHPGHVSVRGLHDADPDDIQTQIRSNDEVRSAMERMPPVRPPGSGRGVEARPPAPSPHHRTAPPPVAALRSVGVSTATGLGDSFLPLSDQAIGPLDNFFDHPNFDGAFDAQQTSNVALPAESRGANASAMHPHTVPIVPPSSAATLAPTPRAASVATGGPTPPLRPQPPMDLPAHPLLGPAKAPRPVGPNGRAMPEARDVLDALQIAGVFEPDGAVRPQIFAWDKPTKAKLRIFSLVSLVGLAVVLVGGATGAYYYVTDRRAKAHVEAERMLAKIETDLATSDAGLLEPSEQAIAKVFDLESRSPRAALTWLHERAMVGLLKGGENVAFEDGTVRAKEVGVEERRLAFTYVASFLFQGDTAGAASALAKWDGKADDDAWYQVVAGATFERAGDPRAADRYAAAVKLDPQLVIAQVLLARANAVDGDPHRAAGLAKEFSTKHPNRVESAALVALAWARDPLRGDPPAEAKEIVDKVDLLPTPLKAVASAVRALLALEQHKTDEAKAALQKGLAVTDTPGIAAWLGSIALATGDEGLARKGALAAVSFSAVYPPARMLAARVALLGARLDEALKASEELAPTSPDVAIVAAAVAYEKLDGERMRSALDALPDDARKLPFLVPLLRGQELMSGMTSALTREKVVDLADGETPWADLVAMDAALEIGDLELAHKVAARWQGEPKAMRGVRLARLARWDGKNDEAERLSRIALEKGTVTVRALAERVFVLIALNKASEAVALFKAYPNVGGPLAKWLRAYAIASNGKTEEARAIISQEDPPPALAPLPARVIAASAFGAVKDTRRGNEYVKALLAAGFGNPDVVTASEKLSGGKAARKR